MKESAELAQGGPLGYFSLDQVMKAWFFLQVYTIQAGDMAGIEEGESDYSIVHLGMLSFVFYVLSMHYFVFYLCILVQKILPLSLDARMKPKICMQ
jgi:hypothetical protein